MSQERRERNRSRRPPAPRRPPAGRPSPRDALRGRTQRRRYDARAYHRGAQQQLRRFRQGTALAVAITALLLLVWGGPLEIEGQQPDAEQPPLPEEIIPDPAAAMDEAATTIRELAYGFYAFLPRLGIVLLLVGLAMVLARLTHALIRRTLGGWQRTEAISAVTRVAIYLVAVIASLSVLAGDVRAIVGSVGLLGLAASWALQTPIESFTGWLLNSFRAYYRVGDRIAVGEVFGDVYRIDMLTTTVWEAGGEGKPVAAAQATGALITFPNWEILRSNVVNFSRDFPYVWDEVTVNVANESDLAYTAEVLEAMARRVLGEEMSEAAERYQQILAAQRLDFDVDEVPRVYFSLADSWTDCTIRFLIPVRSRRRWSSAMVLAASQELARPEHQGRILPVYPRREVTIRRDWEGEP